MLDHGFYPFQPGGKDYMSNRQMSQYPGDTEHGQNNGTSRRGSINDHVKVPAGNVDDFVNKTSHVVGLDIETRGDVDGENLAYGYGIVVDISSAECAGENVCVEGIQTGLVYVEDVVTVELH